MMKNQQQYKQNLTLFLENFNFSINEVYCGLVWNFLCESGVTDEQFQEAVFFLIKRGDVRRRPSVAEWLGYIKGTKSPREQAEVEVSAILEAAGSYFGQLESSSETTMIVIEKMGGLKKVKWSLDADNPHRRQEEWLRKELMDCWLAHHNLSGINQQPRLEEEKSANIEINEKIEKLTRNLAKSMTGAMEQQYKRIN